MRAIKYTRRFKRDYRREQSGKHSKTLNADLLAVVNLLTADAPLPHRNFDHPLSARKTSRTQVVHVHLLRRQPRPLARGRRPVASPSFKAFLA